MKKELQNGIWKRKQDASGETPKLAERMPASTISVMIPKQMNSLFMIQRIQRRSD